MPAMDNRQFIHIKDFHELIKISNGSLKSILFD